MDKKTYDSMLAELKIKAANNPAVLSNLIKAGDASMLTKNYDNASALYNMATELDPSSTGTQGKRLEAIEQWLKQP